MYISKNTNKLKYINNQFNNHNLLYKNRTYRIKISSKVNSSNVNNVSSVNNRINNNLLLMLIINYFKNNCNNNYKYNYKQKEILK